MAGLSFFPSGAPSAEDRSSADALSPGQSPVRTMSLYLPKILGAKSPTSPGLLGGAGGMTTDPSHIVMSALLKAMMPGAQSMDAGSSFGSGGTDDLLAQLHRMLRGAGMGATPGPSAPLTPTFNFGDEGPSAPTAPEGPQELPTPQPASSVPDNDLFDAVRPKG